MDEPDLEIHMALEGRNLNGAGSHYAVWRGQGVDAE
jgi:hypothetical protein